MTVGGSCGRAGGAIRSLGFALWAAGSCCLGICSAPLAAESLPDILGLKRLTAEVSAAADAEGDKPLIREEQFVLQSTAADAAQQPTVSETPDDSRREQLLGWLNEYAKNQVLLTHAD